MIYEITYIQGAMEDITALKKSEISAYNKVLKLIEELHNHPRTGTGKPEMLKYRNISDLWSRRITPKHRLVYQIKDSEILVLVLAAKGHYGDK
jgi:toxin YoeB